MERIGNILNNLLIDFKTGKPKTIEQLNRDLPEHVPEYRDRRNDTPEQERAEEDRRRRR